MTEIDRNDTAPGTAPHPAAPAAWLVVLLLALAAAWFVVAAYEDLRYHPRNRTVEDLRTLIRGPR